MHALLFAVALAGNPTASELKADLTARERQVGEHAKYPLGFTDKELEKLAQGKVVRRRERLEGVDRVIGSVWSTYDKDRLWAALQDEEHFDLIEGYFDEDLPGSVFADRILYQRIDFPWPFASRQWVIRVKNNRELLEATDGAVWERYWDLDPARGASLEEEDAIWISLNDGAWFLHDAAGGTILTYHVRTVIDGNVPNEAVVRWSMATLSGMLTGIVEKADEIPTHYVEGHRQIERPDGTMVPLH